MDQSPIETSASRDNYTSLETIHVQRAVETGYAHSGTPYTLQVQPDSDSKDPSSLEINSVSLSASGSHVVTISYSPTTAFVDVWDLQYNVTSPPKVTGASCARVILPWVGEKVLRSSISWSGQKLAVYSSKKISVKRQDPVQIFERPLFVPADERPLALTATGTIGFLPLSVGTGKGKSLNDFVGMAKFHICENGHDKDKHESEAHGKSQKEHFLTCDGISFSVYGIREGGSWTRIYALTLGVYPLLGNARFLIESCGGQYGAWVGQKGVVSLVNIEKGALEIHIPSRHEHPVCAAALSKNKQWVAVADQIGITVYRVDSGIEYKRLRVDCVFFHRMRFIRGDTQLLVDWGQEKPKIGEGKFAAVLDLETMEEVEVYPALKVSGYEVMEDDGDGAVPFVVRSQGSRLEIQPLEDLRIQELGREQNVCQDEECNQGLCQVDMGESSLQLDSGVQLSIKLIPTVFKDERQQRVLKSVVITREIPGLSPEEILVVNPTPVEIQNENSVVFRNAFFIALGTRVVIHSETMIQIWSIPKEDDEDQECQLLLLWKSQGGHILTSAAVCDHGQLILSSAFGNHFRVSPSKAFSASNARYFLDAIAYLPVIYSESDDRVRGAIVRYVARYINTNPTPVNNPLQSIVTVLCQSWKPEYREAYKLFASDIFLSCSGNSISLNRWIPLAHYPQKRFNPLCILLKTARFQPKAIAFGKILISYLIRQAHQERNLVFLSPIHGCMFELVKLFPDVALDATRAMTFIRPQKRSFVINNHVIAHPPRLRRMFWRPETVPLYECNDPVFQTKISVNEKTDPLNENFTRDVYTASFDMLWRDAERKEVVEEKELNEQDELEEEAAMSRVSEGGKEVLVLKSRDMAKSKTAIKKSEDKATVDPYRLTNWYHTTYHLFASWPMGRNAIASHDYSLRFYDNPAIEALVEYKWNKIGYKLWLARFSVQVAYYALILLVALFQVYSTTPSKLYGVYLAIIVVSSFFFLLELVQFKKNWSRYVQSPYNILDLAVFTVPLGASIKQVVSIQANDGGMGSPRLFSFSVLLVFLHLFFELRINKSVCKFVAVMLRVIVEIQVFFIIFAVAILFFSLAILHLLKGCTLDAGCPYLEGDSDFPTHLFAAISSTYFMVGGRYDSVSSKFESQDWAFHIMMMTYFFFTVILMINFLIVLVNVAFSKGDDSWRRIWVENRLRYVEAAENMSFHIPGFRRTHNWFPKEIYYTSVPSRVMAYREKFQNDGAEDADKDDHDASAQSSWIPTVEHAAGQMAELVRTVKNIQEVVNANVSATSGGLQPGGDGGGSSGSGGGSRMGGETSRAQTPAPMPHLPTFRQPAPIFLASSRLGQSYNDSIDPSQQQSLNQVDSLGIRNAGGWDDVPMETKAPSLVSKAAMKRVGSVPALRGAEGLAARFEGEIEMLKDQVLQLVQQQEEFQAESREMMRALMERLQERP